MADRAVDETPELRRLRRRIDALDRRIVTLLNERAELGREVGREKAAAGRQAILGLQAEAIRNLAFGYAEDPPPATFRVIVNPLVVWVWVGGLIALGGALFAVWPTAESRRRAEAAYAARLGQELSRG